MSELSRKFSTVQFLFESQAEFMSSMSYCDNVSKHLVYSKGQWLFHLSLIYFLLDFITTFTIVLLLYLNNLYI